MVTIDQFVDRNILCCVSSLVSDLANAYGRGCSGEACNQIGPLMEEAFELACPVQDYEEALLGNGGWSQLADGTWKYVDPIYVNRDPDFADTAEEACELHSIEPYEWEVYEHWAITGWLADKLRARGEKVGELSELTVWARTTTGQSISMDGVIQRIYAELQQEYPESYKS